MTKDATVTPQCRNAHSHVTIYFCLVCNGPIVSPRGSVGPLAPSTHFKEVHSTEIQTFVKTRTTVGATARGTHASEKDRWTCLRELARGLIHLSLKVVGSIGLR